MEFWRFSGGLTADVLLPDYSLANGWAAGLLAVVAALAFLNVITRIRAAPTTTARRAWLLGGALSIGIGIWGTKNLVLMDLDLKTAYTVVAWLSMLSILPAAGSAAVALYLVNRAGSRTVLHAAAIVLALGVTATHLSLMEAVTGDLLFTYEPVALLQSLLIAYALLLAGLYGLRQGRADSNLPRRLRMVSALAGSLLVGAAVLGNSYATLAGTTFFDNPAVVSTVHKSVPAFLVPTLVGAVLLVAAAYWLGGIVDDRLYQAGEAVRRSEAWHRAVVETMLDAHVITDAAGNIVSFNPAAEEMFGWRASEVIGKSGRGVFRHDETSAGPDRSWDRFRRRAERDMARRRTGRNRWVHPEGGIRRDGSRFPIEVTVSPFIDQGRKFYSCTVRDLTERWVIDTRLERLAAAIENAGDAIAVLGHDFTVQYVNPQYERLTGFQRDEVLGRQLPQGLGEDGVYAAIRATVERGEVWSGELRLRRRDATAFDSELTITPAFDEAGEVATYVAVLRDITRRLEADLERRRLAEALQHCSDAIEILDLQGRIVYVNAAYEARTGHRLADIRGSRPEALLDFGPDVDSYNNMMDTVVRGGRAWSGVLRVRDIAGELQEEQVTVSPIRDNRNQVTGYVVVKRPAPARAVPPRQLVPTLRVVAGEGT